MHYSHGPWSRGILRPNSLPSGVPKASRRAQSARAVRSAPGGPVPGEVRASAEKLSPKLSPRRFDRRRREYRSSPPNTSSEYRSSRSPPLRCPPPGNPSRRLPGRAVLIASPGALGLSWDGAARESVASVLEPSSSNRPRPGGGRHDWCPGQSPPPAPFARSTPTAQASVSAAARFLDSLSSAHRNPIPTADCPFWSRS